MRMHRILLAGMMVLAVNAGAQQRTPGRDTVLKGSTIEVIQAYKPQVKQAPKPEWVPQLPPPDTTHAEVAYNDVPQQSLFFSYTSLPLHPLALGQNAQKLPFPNYVKLGGGNLSTIYLDAGIGGIYDKDYETAIHLHHMSQKGSTSYQKSSLSGIEADGVYHAAKADWHAGVTAKRNQFYEYGYLPHLYLLSDDSVKETYTGVGIVADMKNKDDSNTVFQYHPLVRGSLYTGRDKSSEVTVGFDVPMAYHLSDNVKVLVGVNGAFSKYKNDSMSTGNNLIAVLPGFSAGAKKFRGHAILGLGHGGTADADGKPYFLPDIYAAYTFTDNTLFAGVKFSVTQNTFEQLSTENPWIAKYYPTIHSKNREYFIGMTGGTNNHFSYSFRMSYWNYEWMQFFLNGFGDQRQFAVGYYSNPVNAFTFKVSGRYKASEKISAGIAADIYRYSTSAQSFFGYASPSESFVFGKPGSVITGDLAWTPVKNLYVSAYVSVMGGIRALDSYGKVVQLKTFADIGGSAEYQFIPRLSGFLQLNNILNDKYQRWLGYYTYGINIYGGLKLKF